MAAVEGGPPRCFHPHCPPGYPLGAEDALEGPGPQYHQPLLPVGVGQHLLAREPAEEEEEGPEVQYRHHLQPGGVGQDHPELELAEAEEEGRSPARGPQ